MTADIECNKNGAFNMMSHSATIVNGTNCRSMLWQNSCDNQETDFVLPKSIDKYLNQKNIIYCCLLLFASQDHRIKAILCANIQYNS